MISLKKIDDIMYNFLWSGKTHKVKRNVIIQEPENGGCKMISLTDFLKSQRLKWVKKIL